MKKNFETRMVIITSKTFLRYGELPTSTELNISELFRTVLMEDYSKPELLKLCKDYKNVMVCGYDVYLENVIKELKKMQKKIFLYIHFLDTIFNASFIQLEKWNSILKLEEQNCIDMLVFSENRTRNMWSRIPKIKQCKKFWFMNNSTDYKYLSEDKKIVVGIYSGNYEFDEISIQSLLAVSEHVLPVDIVPLSPILKRCAEKLNLKVSGVEKLDKSAFIERIVHFRHVIYSSASTMTVLQTLMNGVLGITVNNHHLFSEDSFLKECLVVDYVNSNEISKKLGKAIFYKDDILIKFFEWKRNWDELCKQNLEKFLKFLD